MPVEHIDTVIVFVKNVFVKLTVKMIIIKEHGSQPINFFSPRLLDNLPETKPQLMQL